MLSNTYTEGGNSISSSRIILSTLTQTLVLTHAFDSDLYYALVRPKLREQERMLTRDGWFTGSATS